MRFTFIRGVGFVPSAQEQARIDREEARAARRREQPAEPYPFSEPASLDGPVRFFDAAAWSEAPLELVSSSARPVSRRRMRKPPGLE